MAKSLKEAVSASRRLSENPYAYVEYLDEANAELTERENTSPFAAQISVSRKLLQDPYAYLDESGGYSAEAPSTGRTHPPAATNQTPRTPSNQRGASPRYSIEAIETRAKEVQRQLWKDRASLWNGEMPTDPIKFLDPAVALHLFGYEYELAEGLGQHRVAGRLVEVAGLIDRKFKTVHISRQFPFTIRTFTAAHELGHAVLHQAGGGVHRDRPLDGTGQSREPTEFEADKFATYFLMPARLLKARFVSIFGVDCFVPTEDSLFALAGSSLAEFQEKYRTRRDLSRVLASTDHYNGQQFPCLATQFRVSTEAMAIRLEELGLLPD